LPANPTRAFTLVELLVVIATLVVVLAMLGSALGTARSAARRTVCAVNLRSLRDALVMYCQDENRGRLPLVDSPTVVNGSMTETRIRAPYEAIRGALGVDLPAPRGLIGALPMVGSAWERLPALPQPEGVAGSPLVCPDDLAFAPRLGLSYDLRVSGLWHDPVTDRADRRQWAMVSRWCDDQQFSMPLWADLNFGAHDRIAPPQWFGCQASFSDGRIDWTASPRRFGNGD